ncbi:hypothetical protein [Microbulbifer sp. HZ11]|uniref:hypothetical protein n=1 Tax=Microbulbifer sp. HZ11 TaxID=1453501 RepID=UPI0012DE9DAA|nr:hypothetical protein [Microbulbifer sp. HZ11]
MGYTLLDQFMIDYFDENEVELPDMLIPGEVLDHRAREQAGDSYPFTGIQERGGCYFIFDSYFFSSFASVNPIYVGRSGELNNRLRTHWCSKESVIGEYFKRHFDSGLLDVNERLDSGESVTVRPSAPTCIAVWFLAGERDRMLFEHELIYKFEPLMNKD